ncbi:MAG: hypothetical protein ACSHWN_06585 [Methylophilaceae bacterium]
MPYVLRGQDWVIKAISQSPMTAQGWEEISSGEQEYLDFLDEALKNEDRFRESDIQLARVLEDLISLLIDRDFIRFTDFPDAAQKKLIERQGFRSGNTNLNLLDDEDAY